MEGMSAARLQTGKGALDMLDFARIGPALPFPSHLILRCQSGLEQPDFN